MVCGETPSSSAPTSVNVLNDEPGERYACVARLYWSAL